MSSFVGDGPGGGTITSYCRSAEVITPVRNENDNYALTHADVYMCKARRNGEHCQCKPAGFERNTCRCRICIQEGDCIMCPGSGRWEHTACIERENDADGEKAIREKFVDVTLPPRALTAGPSTSSSSSSLNASSLPPAAPRCSNAQYQYDHSASTSSGGPSGRFMQKMKKDACLINGSI